MLCFCCLSFHTLELLYLIFYIHMHWWWTLVDCCSSWLCHFLYLWKQQHHSKTSAYIGAVNGNCGLMMVLLVLMIILTMAMSGFLWLYSWCFLGQTMAFAILGCNFFLLPPLLWSPAVAWFFLGGLVTSAGLGKGNLATSSQMVNDFPQGFCLHGNKQIPLGWSLATNQTWNLSGTQ